MATTVGEAVVKLTFDGKEAKSEMSKTQKAVSNFGSAVGNIAGKIGTALKAGFAVATTAAIAFAKKSIDAFNIQEEALAKLEQSAKNQKWAKNAVDDLKAYNAELQKTGIIGDEVNAAGQAQLGTFGLSEKAVKKLTPAMDDLIAATSGYKATTDSATQMANLMGKVMTGNVGALTRYGVTLSENQKKLLQSGDEMKRASVLAEVLAQNYGGFNEKLAQTPQGAVKQLGNSFGDLKESIGALIAGKGSIEDITNNVQKFLDKLTDTVVAFAPEFVDGFSKIIEFVPVILDKLVDTIKNLLSDSSRVKTVVSGFVSLFVAVAKAGAEIAMAIIPLIPEIIGQIVSDLTKEDNLLKVAGAFAILFGINVAKAIIGSLLTTVLPAIMSAITTLILSPIGLAIAGIGLAVVGVVAVIIANWEPISEFFTNLFGQIGEFISGVWNGICEGAQNAWNFITGLFGQLASFFGSIFSSAWEAVKAVFSTGGRIFMGIVDGITNAFRTIVNAIITGINHVVAIPFNAINGFLSFLKGIDILGIKPFGWVGTINVPQIPLLAKGGYADGATLATIGEAGKEVVLPLENNTDNWAGLLASELAKQFDKTESVSGRPIVVNMTNEINNEMDADDIGRKLMESIRRAS